MLLKGIYFKIMSFYIRILHLFVVLLKKGQDIANHCPPDPIKPCIQITIITNIPLIKWQQFPEPPG